MCAKVENHEIGKGWRLRKNEVQRNYDPKSY